MGGDQSSTSPTVLDNFRGAGGKSDQRVGGRHEDVLLLGVRRRVGMVRVAQVVNRVHKRLVVHLECLYDVGERVGADGVEAEVDVKDVELVVMLLNPRRIQHQWRPPATGYGALVGRDRVGQTDYGVAARGMGQVTDIDV